MAGDESAKTPSARDPLVAAKPGQAQGAQIGDSKTGSYQHIAQVVGVEDFHVCGIVEDRVVAVGTIRRQQQKPSAGFQYSKPFAASPFVQSDVLDDVL